MRALKPAMSILLGVSVAVGISAFTDAQWPQISPGVWHVSAKRTLANGKVEHWERTSKHCEDPTILFKGYWGKANLDKAGCQFESKEMSSGTYRISSECLLANGGKSVGVANVVLDGNKRFHLTAQVTEKRSQSSATEDGELVSGCSEK
jgi:hypothetical protein